MDYVTLEYLTTNDLNNIITIFFILMFIANLLALAVWQASGIVYKAFAEMFNKYVWSKIFKRKELQQ